MKPWLLLLTMLAACGRPGDDGPVRVSVIGTGAPALVDPNRRAPDPAQRVLLGAVAEGLVTYDESGKVAPALAQRWIVTSDGLSAIFRLRRATWPDGKPITSGEMVRRARAMLAPASRNPLRDAFDSIEEINATTPEVIEFRLITPRPPLLELLAQPEAVLMTRAMGSSGVFRIAGRAGDTVTLARRAAPVPDQDPDHGVALTGERGAMAVARFVAGETELVLGGTYLDWPLLAIAKPQNRAIRIDPAEGLFGLVVQKADGFLADPLNRQALGMAIDRDAILAAFAAPGWSATLAVLPRSFRSAAAPANPPWAVIDLAARTAEAQRRVQAWGQPVRVRVFLPDAPGTNLLFGRLAADWRRIGIAAERSSLRDADVRLIDEVAPAGSAVWYLDRLACPAPATCALLAKEALERVRKSQSLVERGAQLAYADSVIANAGVYVPIARPLRWSLVAPRLTLFRENAIAWHPLDRLVRPRR